MQQSLFVIQIFCETGGRKILSDKNILYLKRIFCDVSIYQLHEIVIDSQHFTLPVSFGEEQVKLSLFRLSLCSEILSCY